MRLLALAAASACAASSLAAARPDADVTVTADLGGAPTWASFFMLDCVGASHGEMYMWEDNRNHLRAIARDIGFRHVRGHGLLDDDLSTYLNGAANMYNLHSIFDFLLSINVRPIFELSFTPSELASDPNDSLMHYRGNASPAKDRNASAGHAWFDFIHDMVQDLVDRYGVEEIRRWRFEHYNEPVSVPYPNDARAIRLHALTHAHTVTLILCPSAP
jgi:xylan 1,4-beta-xylosidase